jgi:hypothetical protein
MGRGIEKKKIFLFETIGGLYLFKFIREFEYSGADVAGYLGVTTSCINRSVTFG